MIKIVKGVYGKREGQFIVRMNKNSAPFELPEAEEKRLVSLGFAEYVSANANGETPAPEAVEPEAEEPKGEAAPAVGESEIDFNEMTLTQLKLYAEQNGIEIKSNTPKAKVIEAIKAALKDA